MGLIVNIFLGVLLFGGLLILLIIFLSKVLKPNKTANLRTLIKSSNYKQAIKIAKEILTKEPNNSEAHFHLAESYYNEGKYELALVEYKSADKIGQYNAYIAEYDLRIKLGELYEKFENIDEALKEYLLLQQKFQNDPMIYSKLGDLFTQKNLRDQAVANYTKSLSLNPNYVPALISNGILLYEMKRLGDAVKNLEHAVKIQPANYKAHFYLGMVKKAESNMKGALKHFDISVRDKDYKVRSLLEKGQIEMSSGKYEDAIIDLERALKSTDNEKSTVTLNIRYILATCYEQMRNITEAIQQWEKIYSLKADFKDVGEKLVNYQELRLDDRMKDFMTATNDEFIDICKKITLSMGFSITDLSNFSTEGIQMTGIESGNKWRNVKKKPVLIYVFRKSTPVDEQILRKIHEYMRQNEIMKAYVISASDFTKPCNAFVQERPIELVDKNGIIDLLKKVNI